MSISTLGHLTHRDESEAHLADGPSLDVEYIKRQAREHESAGFDGVLVGGGGDGPDSLQIAALASAHTERLRYLVAYRPGLISPTLAARIFATLDQINNGRTAIHVITGREKDGQSRYGDPLGKDDRYKRTREFIQILKKSWTERQPFDVPGEYFDIRGFVASVFPKQNPRIPVSFAGNSEGAFAVGAAEADAYAFYAQPLDLLVKDIARVQEEARAAGRSEPPKITILVRLIVGETEELAWQKAERLRVQVAQQAGTAAPAETRWVPANDGRQASAGDQRQIDVGATGERHDRALWTGLVSITGRGKSTALVGTSETIVAALLDYVDVGVTTFILDGFKRYHDVPEFGRSIIPAFREALRARSEQVRAAE